MLIDDIRVICADLADAGWNDLLHPHGLNLKADDLLHELTIKQLGVERSLPGFEDFALEGIHAVEAGNPAHSLLYHALASPNVLTGPSGSPERFATLAELDALENFIYSLERVSIQDLRDRHAGSNLAIVVFAYEYRPAQETCHRRHADMCYSQTGIGRVGTAPPVFDAMRRGFLPHVDGEARDMRVLPVKYSAFVARQRTGSRTDFCPMDFRTAAPETFNRSDAERNFWVPVHKLFSGDECLRGVADLDASLTAHHVNEKLRRIHIALRKPLVAGGPPRDTGWKSPEIDNPPFRFTEDIAKMSNDPELGPGVVEPIPHPLAEPAERNGKPVYFKIPDDHPKPPNGSAWFSSSLLISSVAAPNLPFALRPAPEYVNVRHRLISGKEVNLNTGRDDAGNTVLTNPNVVQLVADYSTPARHYIDYTADGWVEFPKAQAQALGLERHAAYSLVTAPDFYPNSGQRELSAWISGLPVSIRGKIWASPPPIPLSAQRLAPNLQLPGSGFKAADDTITAVVPGHQRQLGTRAATGVLRTARHSPLPDESAGIFHPGWEVSIDRDAQGELHLAAYGLGSPFAEDAKLCAALSTYWPGVAPDATRQFSPIGDQAITVAPLTDEETGMVGALPWDGVPGPKLVLRNGVEFANYASFAHVDYVDSALEGRFSLALLSHTSNQEYQHRLLAMLRVYQVLARQLDPNDTSVSVADKSKWLLFSLRVVTPGDPELLTAQSQAQGSLEGTAYRFEMIRNGSFVQAPDDPRRREVRVTGRTILFAGALRGSVRRVLSKTGTSPWRRTEFGAT